MWVSPDNDHSDLLSPPSAIENKCMTALSECPGSPGLFEGQEARTSRRHRPSHQRTPTELDRLPSRCRGPVPARLRRPLTRKSPRSARMSGTGQIEKDRHSRHTAGQPPTAEMFMDKQS